MATRTEPIAEPAGAVPPARFALSEEQKAFFATFGFLKLPGLFRPEIERLTTGFEQVFAEQATWDTNEELHFDARRSIIPGIVSMSDDLAWLLDDHRVTGITSDLIGPDVEYAESDGNLFYCETSWHSDNYSAPLDRFHVKLSFYLDALDAESGAIRMIPGTNFWQSEFATSLRRDLATPARTQEVYGVRWDDIPSWPLATEPGDLVVWNFRTVHASFNGGLRRRLFSLNFCEPAPTGSENSPTRAVPLATGAHPPAGDERLTGPPDEAAGPSRSTAATEALAGVGALTADVGRRARRLARRLRRPARPR